MSVPFKSFRTIAGELDSDTIRRFLKWYRHFPEIDTRAGEAREAMWTREAIAWVVTSWASRTEIDRKRGSDEIERLRTDLGDAEQNLQRAINENNALRTQLGIKDREIAALKTQRSEAEAWIDEIVNLLSAERDILRRALLDLFPGEFTREMLLVSRGDAAGHAARKLADLFYADRRENGQAANKLARDKEVAELRAVCGTALLIANLRTARMKAALQPEVLCRTLFEKSAHMLAYGINYEDLDATARKHYEQYALKLQAHFLDALEGRRNLKEDNAEVQEILLASDQLAAAMAKLEELRDDYPRQLLEGLSDELDQLLPGTREQNPTLADGPRRALVFIRTITESIPLLMSQMQLAVIQPAISILRSAGVELPEDAERRRRRDTAAGRANMKLEEAARLRHGREQ